MLTRLDPLLVHRSSSSIRSRCDATTTSHRELRHIKGWLAAVGLRQSRERGAANMKLYGVWCASATRALAECSNHMQRSSLPGKRRAMTMQRGFTRVLLPTHGRDLRLAVAPYQMGRPHTRMKRWLLGLLETFRSKGRPSNVLRA